MRKAILLVVLVFGCSSLIFAGVTGKIDGSITDSQTGQSLIGVNVVIQGTSYGAATDNEGYFVILNIPAGNYSVKASMIGYQDITMSGVRVSIDLSTRLDFKLSSEVLEASESVVIIAKRPLLKRDEFTSRTTVSTEEIEIQPIDDFQSIARNQAGVVGSHFRGGRTGEVLVLIDGLPVKDPAGEYSGNMGGFTADIPEAGIQEMEITLGGFSAEYGNVQSGILNLAMKEGGSKYSGKVRVSSTNFGSGLNDLLMGERDRWFDTKYQHKLENIYQLSLSGPVPGSGLLFGQPGALNFSLSGEITDRGQGYFINSNLYKESLQGKITARLGRNIKISAGGLYSRREWDHFYFQASKYGPGDNYLENEYGQYKSTGNNTIHHYVYVNNPAKHDDYGARYDSLTQFIIGRDTLYSDTVSTIHVGPMQDYLWNYAQSSNNQYIVLTHQLSARTYYDFRYQRYYSNYHYATPDIEDRDGDGNTTEDLVWDPNLEGPHPIYRERLDNYWWLRGDDPGYRDQTSVTNTVKLDLVSQLNHNNLVKSGLEFSHHDMDVENVSWTLGYGTNRLDIWKQDMIDVGVYIQDKIDYEGIVALIGIRYDYFNPSGFGETVTYPGDFSNPFTDVDSIGEAILIDPQKATYKHQISPRIAVSHPITERDMIRFSYGHYFQRPDGYYMYRNLTYRDLTKAGNYVGNPGLAPEKTVAYEIGVEHLFTDNIKLSINGYYKDVTNLMNIYHYVLRNYYGTEANIFVNADYGNMKGLEFSLIKRLGDFWGGSVNYTFSVVKGRSSSTTSGAGAFDSERRLNVLDFDQTHTVNANLTFKTPRRYGIIWGSWLANFQYNYGSGLPYSSYGTGKINDLRMPWTSNTDLRISKDIGIARTTLNFYLDIFNLFNRQNIDWIGSSYYYQVDQNSKCDPAVVYKEGLAGDYIRNPQTYSDERQFRFGVSIQF
ncbi:MAG: TonB-dependent receptor [Candidatus Marinimicrobia bacterium]|nr:TonB-dependent receptor [Candidatus Neomarinimicrobiota bacterium]